MNEYNIQDLYNLDGCVLRALHLLSYKHQFPLIKK